MRCADARSIRHVRSEAALGMDPRTSTRTDRSPSIGGKPSSQSSPGSGIEQRSGALSSSAVDREPELLEEDVWRARRRRSARCPATAPRLADEAVPGHRMARPRSRVAGRVGSEHAPAGRLSSCCQEQLLAGHAHDARLGTPSSSSQGICDLDRRGAAPSRSRGGRCAGSLRSPRAARSRRAWTPFARGRGRTCDPGEAVPVA